MLIDASSIIDFASGEFHFPFSFIYIAWQASLFDFRRTAYIFSMLHYISLPRLQYAFLTQMECFIECKHVSIEANKYTYRHANMAATAYFWAVIYKLQPQIVLLQPRKLHFTSLLASSAHTCNMFMKAHFLVHHQLLFSITFSFAYFIGRGSYTTSPISLLPSYFRFLDSQNSRGSHCHRYCLNAIVKIHIIIITILLGQEGHAIHKSLWLKGYRTIMATRRSFYILLDVDLLDALLRVSLHFTAMISTHIFHFRPYD